MKYNYTTNKFFAALLLCFLYTFFSGNVHAQLTYITCNSSCPSTQVGKVTFANKSGTTTGRWTLSDIDYGGLTNESFAIRDPAAYTFASGDLTSTGGGTYTIVSNPSIVNGPTGVPLQNVATPNNGIFLFRPNDATNAFAVYKISGLQVGQKYCVRVKMRNATAHKDCNQSLYTTIQFKSLTGLGISGGGVSGGTWTNVSSNPACPHATSGGWDGNNQSYGLLYDEDYSWYETNFQLGQNPNNTNDDGFTLNFQANAWDADDVWGIEEIDVYGCITQQILSSNGTSVCDGTPTVLTAQGIGSTTDTYTWKQSTDGGATFTTIPSSTSNTLSVTPAAATEYSVTCTRTGLTITSVITPVNCCGPTGLFTIPKVCAPITIDGNDDEPVWYTAPWQNVTQPFTLSGNQDCINASPACAGTQANPAGQWRCVRTNTDIYFDIRVNDAAPQNTAQVYYQDAVEIYIANNANTPLQFGYEYKNGTPGFYNSNGAVNGAAFVITTPTYWDLEVRIPITANNINLNPGFLKMELGINQAKAGCNNCRAAQLFTWIAANHYSSTAQYHTAPLSNCAGVDASDSTVCSGGSTILTTQLSTINPGLPYTWQQSTDGTTWTTIPGTTNTVTVSPSVQTLYRAVYDNVNSCADTIKIGTILLKTNNPAAVCSPNTVDLTAAAVTTGSQAGLTYSYFTDTLTTMAVANPAAVTTGKYFIKGQSSSCFGVKSVTVTINPAPTISGTKSVCVSKATQLTGSGTAAAANPWTSANTAVATIDNTGNITGVSAGTSLITYTNNNTCTDTTTITVNALPVISGGATVSKNGTTQLSGTGTASSWTSANTAVATIDNTGKVTGVSAGTSVITYTNTNGCTATVTVTVTDNPVISGVLNVCVSKTTKLTGSGIPTASNPWTSATPSVATVDNTGLVTGVSNGTSVITYTDINGNDTTATVTVNALPVISGTTTVSKNGTTQLSGTGTAASWVSANTAVATIDNIGNVTGVSAGTSVITYTNTNGCSATATVTVTVNPVISGVLTVCVQSTTKLTGTGTPAVSNPWTSATPSVATIDNTGLVTGVSNGASVITYTDIAGNDTTATVTVNALPVIGGAVNVCIGNTTQLTGSATAAIPIAWTSASQSIATIDNTGLVTGISAGTSQIVYTNSDGCTKDAIVTVSALPAITGTASLCIGKTTQLTGSATPAVSNAWISSDPSIATIDNNGLVTSVSTGTSQITYTNSNGCTKNITVTVGSIPSSPITADTSRCGTGVATLIGSPSTSPSDVLTWYGDPQLTIALATGNIFTTPNISSTTSFYVTETSTSGCTGNASMATVTIIPAPDALFTPLAPVCEGAAPFILTGGSEANNNPGIGFYSGNGVEQDRATFNPQLAGPSVDDPIVFTYVSGNGCSDTAQQSISIYPAPSVNYGGTQYILENDSATLNPLSTSGAALQYLWTPAIYLNNNTIASPVCKPNDSITYTITVTSPGGCQSSDVLFVQVLRNFIVPNTFTPNADGINDNWVIEELPKYPIHKVYVYDRYGQLVFYSEGYNQPWNGTYKGKILGAGTYYYIIELNGILSPKTGYVTILK